jgi:hypothetical protein
MLLNHGKTLGFRKRTHPREVRGIRAVIAREILFAQMSDPIAGGEARHARLHRLLTAAAHEHADLEALRWIRRPHHSCAGNGGSLTALQEDFRHDSPPSVMLER